MDENSSVFYYRNSIVLVRITYSLVEWIFVFDVFLRFDLAISNPGVNGKIRLQIRDYN